MSNYKNWRPYLVSTGQHDELLKSVFDLFEIKPHLSFDIMEFNQDVALSISKILSELSFKIEKIRIIQVSVSRMHKKAF